LRDELLERFISQSTVDERTVEIAIVTETGGLHLQCRGGTALEIDAEYPQSEREAWRLLLPGGTHAVRSGAGFAMERPPASSAVTEIRKHDKRPIAVCLDLDGVVLMSNDAKASLFAEVVAKTVGCDITGIAEFALSGRGIPRREKFAQACIRFADRPATTDEVEAMAALYADAVPSALITCPVVPGIIELLQSARYRFVLCTAAPTDEAFVILRSRGLDGYFDRIAGYPESKVSILMSEAAVGSVVFFGDGEADLEAARVGNVRFIYVGRDAPRGHRSVRTFLPPDEIVGLIEAPRPASRN
jgi:phosphoglycolate phosphatase-like HAD superfamily hydrolase